VDAINALEEQFKTLDDAGMPAKTAEFKERLAKGEALDSLMREAFALVREAARRKLGQRHFDVQLMGGIVLHQGKIAEMRTGEGKTLTATLPVYLNALSGLGVHLVTVNDYLARRDAVWMGQVYHALGLSTGCINHDQSFIYDPEYRKAQENEDTMRDNFGSFHISQDFLRPCSRAMPTRRTLRTVPTTNSGLIICATIWFIGSRIAFSANRISRSSTKSIPF